MINFNINSHFILKGLDGGLDKTVSLSDLKVRNSELLDLVSRHLSSYMIPLSLGNETTINELLRSGKRLLVGYANKKKNYTRSDLLWPSVQHLWGNVDKLVDLENYFSRVVCPEGGNITELRSAMAEFTPTKLGILSDKYGGLRKMAKDVNNPVTTWFRDRWWDCANIVATDFFLGNNIIEVAIEANKKRATLDEE
jgi:hypothetical protein